MSQFTSRLEALVAQKAAKDGRRYKNKEIAEAIDVSESTISRWMRGHGIEGTSLKVVKRLCDWLECDIADLLYIER